MNNLIEKIINLNDKFLLELSKTITTQAKKTNRGNGNNLKKLTHQIDLFKKRLLELNLISNQELINMSDSDIYEKIILGLYLKMVEISS